MTPLELMLADAAICNERLLGAGTTNHGPRNSRAERSSMRDRSPIPGGVRPPGIKTRMATMTLTEEFPTTTQLARLNKDMVTNQVLSAMETATSHGAAVKIGGGKCGAPNQYRRGPNWAAKLQSWGFEV